MAKRYKVTTKFISPIWVNIVTAAIGAVIGLLSLIDGINTITRGGDGFTPIILGVAMILFLGMSIYYAVKKSYKNLVAASIGQMTVYATLSIVTSFSLANIFGQVQTSSQDEEFLKTILVAIYILIGIGYIAVAVLGFIALFMAGKGKTIKGLTIAAASIFLLFQALAYYGLLGQGSSANALLYFTEALLIALGVFTIIVACMTKYETTKVLVDENGNEIGEPENVDAVPANKEDKD